MPKRDAPSSRFRTADGVPQSTLRSFMAKETAAAAVKSILAGIINAEQSAARLELTHLKFDHLAIHIGAIPLVRICWAAERLREAEESVATPFSAPIAAAVSPASTPSTLGWFLNQGQLRRGRRLPGLQAK